MSRAQNSTAATVGSVFAMLAALIAFCAFFTVFLLVPFFVFIAAGVALIIAERKTKAPSEPPVDPAETTEVAP